MRKFLGLKKDERAGAGMSSDSLPPAPLQSDGDDLCFLPPSRPVSSSAASTGQPRRAQREEADAVPMPGANRSKLAGLFADDGDDLFGSAASVGGSKTATAEAAARSEAPPAQPARQTQAASQAQMLWSGSGNLYRLDDDGSAMIEVDAGEGRGSLHGVAVKMASSATDCTVTLIIYTATRRRSRMKLPVEDLDIQAPNEESVCFYDEHGIYWALQLAAASEALALTRVLLAARSLLSGRLQTLETAAGSREDAVGLADSVQLRTTICLLDLAADATLELALESCSEVELQLSDMDRQFGAGAADIIAGLCWGASALLAVPPGLQPPGLQSRCSSSHCVVLVDMQDVQPGRAKSDSASAAATPQRGRTASTASQDADVIPSGTVKERMAKLGVSTLPAVASHGVLQASAALPLATATAADFRNVDAPAAAAEVVPPPAGAGLLAAVAPATLPGAAGFSMPSAAPFPAAGFSSPSPWTQSLAAPGTLSGVPNAHPVADIMRQYWSAVQDTGGGTPYAYLGALPFVPGLTLPAGRPPPHMLQATGSIREPVPVPVPAAASVAMPSSAGSEVQSLEGMRGGAVSASSGSVNMPLRTTPVSSVALGDLVEAIREVVRKEATPEGWQVERQKLERRVALLEEQLNAARAHQEQVRETNRVQLVAMQRQLAESQMMAQQMREQQLRSETDRQMRDWERDAARGSLEAELQQQRSELQQLRLEERSLRDRLADAEIGKQRAEGAAASAAGVAASVPGLEARLQEQISSAAGAQRDLQAVTAQLQALVNARAADAISMCKNTMSIAYVGAKQAVPASGACVDADAVRACLREVCKQSCLALERQLQQVPVDAGNALGEQINWDAVEKLVLASMGPPLQDLSAGMEAAVEQATASAAEAVEKAAAEAARSAAEAKAAATAQATAEAAAKKAAEEKLAVEAESRRAAAEAAEKVAMERAAAEAATQKALEEKWAAEAESRRAAAEAAEKVATERAAAEAAKQKAFQEKLAAEAAAKKALEDKAAAEERAAAELAAQQAKVAPPPEVAQEVAVEVLPTQHEPLHALQRVADEDAAEDRIPATDDQEAAPNSAAQQLDAGAVSEFESCPAEDNVATADAVGTGAEVANDAAALHAVEERAAAEAADCREADEAEAAERAAQEAEAACRAAEEAEAARGATEEAEAMRRAAEEAEAASRAAEEAESARRAAEEAEAARRAAEEAEAARRDAEEAEVLRRAAEEAEAVRRAAEEEEAARRAAHAEEAARKAAEEEEAAAQAEAAQRAAEEAERKATEERKAEEATVSAARAPTPKAGNKGASLFGDEDDDDDDGIFGSRTLRSPRHAPAASNGGAAKRPNAAPDLFGEENATSRGAGGPRKPPKSLFGEDSDTDGSFVFSK